MENVVIERTLAQPLNEQDLRALVGQNAWCLKLNRVRPLHSYLGFDGVRVICVFESPDAEAARRVNHQAGLPATSIWTSSIYEPPAAAPETGELVLVERSFAAPVTVAEIQALEDGGACCLQQHRVRFARTYFAADRRRMICVYRAPDAESVRLAQKTTGMPFDDVWPARQVTYG